MWISWSPKTHWFSVYEITYLLDSLICPHDNDDSKDSHAFPLSETETQTVKEALVTNSVTLETHSRISVQFSWTFHFLRKKQMCADVTIHSSKPCRNDSALFHMPILTSLQKYLRLGSILHRQAPNFCFSSKSGHLSPIWRPVLHHTM